MCVCVDHIIISLKSIWTHSLNLYYDYFIITKYNNIKFYFSLIGV